MKYKAGFKYQLAEDEVFYTPIRINRHISTRFIRLSKGGKLTIKTGYAWDGPSGPTIDTKNFMRGSLSHDALYQLMREGLLGIQWRVPSDRYLQELCLEDGMWQIRAWYVYKGLQVADGDAALPENKKEILEAP